MGLWLILGLVFCSIVQNFSTKLEPKVVAEDRITGHVVEKMVPYIATLLNCKKILICTGAIISKRLVLSAAHCGGIKLFHTIDFVGVGAAGVQYQTYYKVLEIRRHCYFHESHHLYDIMLVSTKINIKYKAGLAEPIPIHTEKIDLSIDQSLKFVSFGTTEANDTVMRWTMLRVVELDMCKSERHRKLMISERINLCLMQEVDYSYNDKHVKPGVMCFGGSGAPLVIDNKILAVASQRISSETCEPGHTSVFTYAYLFHEFVNGSLKQIVY